MASKEKLQKELKELQEKIDALLEQQNQLSASINTMKGEKEKLEKEYNSVVKLVAKQKKYLENAMKTTIQTDEDTVRAKAKLAKVTENLNKTKTTLDELSYKIDDQEKEKIRIEAAIVSIKEQRKADETASRASIVRLREQVSALTRRVQSLSDEAGRIEKKNQEVQLQIKEETKEANVKLKKITKLVSENKKINKTLLVKREWGEKYLESLKSEIVTAEKTLNNVQDDIVKANKDYAKAATAKSQKEKELNKMTKKLIELAQREQVLDQLEAELKDLYDTAGIQWPL